ARGGDRLGGVDGLIGEGGRAGDVGDVVDTQHPTQRAAGDCGRGVTIVDLAACGDAARDRQRRNVRRGGGLGQGVVARVATTDRQAADRHRLGVVNVLVAK